MLKKLILTIFILSMPVLVQAARVYKESYYQNNWAVEHNGVTEYKLDDGTRVDVLTDSYAVEFDFAQKWAEAVGQSLYYAYKTGKQPAIVLIIEKPSDWKYFKRVKTLCERYNIKLWTVKSPLYNQF